MARPRMILRIDPLLLLGALGLIACSLITLRNAIHNTALMDRQAIYAGLGLLVALILSRIDYSRLREYKFGLFGAMVALNLVVYGMPQIAGRPALDSAALHGVSVLGVRQGARDRGPGCVRRRSLAAPG